MIIGVIGKPRQGKTLFITLLLWLDSHITDVLGGGDSLDKLFARILGYSEYSIIRRVYANYPLGWDYTPYDLDDVLSIKHMKMDINPKSFGMQEAGKWFDSRNSMSPENRDLINFTGQSGKRETNLYYDDQFITRIDKGLRDVTEKSYIANCTKRPDGTPVLFEYEEYGGYFQYPTGRTLKFPAFWMSKFYNLYDTRHSTIKEI